MAVSIVASQVSRSGGPVILFTGVTPAVAFPGENRAFIHSFNVAPTFRRNGTIITPWLNYWSDVFNRVLPYAAFLFPNGSDTLIFADDDVVTWDAPANWCVTSVGNAPAQTGTCGNYVGGWEPGVFDYHDFDPATFPKTFVPGFLLSGAYNGPVTHSKNLLHSTSNPWTGAATSTADGIPLTFGSSGTISSTVWTGGTNGLDTRGYPAPQGTYTLIGDESAPGAPVLPSLTGNEPSLIGSRVITGSTTNKKFEWGVTWGAGTFNSGFTLTLTAPGAAPHTGKPVTLTNMKLFQGGDTPANSIAPEDDLNDYHKAMMNIADGVSVSVGRFLDGWPSASTARPTDIMAEGLFSYSPLPAVAANVWPISEPDRTGNRVIPIAGVRHYDLTQSPSVYYLANWGGVCVTSDQPSIAPWMRKPVDVGLNNGWPFKTGTPTRAVIMEVITGTDLNNLIPHNLASTQIVSFQGLPTATCFNSGGTGLATAGGSAIIQVTGPTTFLIVANSNMTNVMDVGQVTIGAPQAQTGKTCTLFDGHSISTKQKAGFARVDGNPVVQFCMNHAMGDPAVREWAQRSRASTPAGVRVKVQLSNEPFIGSTVATVFKQLAIITGYAWEDTAPIVVHRASQIHDIWEEEWGEGPDAIIRVFQPWTQNANFTTRGLSYAHDNSIKIDEIDLAPYEDNDASTANKMVAAAIVADLPDSIAHPSKGGLGIRTTWPIVADLARLYFRYNRYWNGNNTGGSSTGTIGKHIVARNATHYGEGGGTSHFTYPMPYFSLYEGSITEYIPPAVSTTTKKVRWGLSHDGQYHPSFYEVQMAFFQHLQCPGPIGFEGFKDGALTSLISGRTFSTFNAGFVCPDGSDGSFVALWGNMACWQAQQRGYGLANKYWAQTPAYNGDGKAHDFENENPAGQQAADWILGVIPPEPPDPTPPPSVGRRRFFVAPTRRARR